jgi:UDP-N-acetylglucosamine/UDP-N-acetylgalactosamine diphosphorylase
MRETKILEDWSDRGQEHLFAYWSERSDDKKKALLRDLESLDTDLFQQLQEQLQLGLHGAVSHRIEPIAHIPEEHWLEDAVAQGHGQELLAAGKAAYLTVAGGQGSRLGFDGPKGCFPISPIRGATLFQLFSEKILAARRRYGRPQYWYIMTSSLNLEKTRGFFEANGYFGLPEEEVLFFSQGLFPSLTEEGKLMLAEDGGLFQNPNGHGGTIAALQDSGCLDHLQARGVEELFYWQVDNPLVRIPDTHFLGGHTLKNSQMSSKVVEKAYPGEKIGVCGRLDGKPAIIEYSDFSPEQMQARDAGGRLLYSHGSIAIHILNVEFLCSSSGKLPLHVARKKIRAWIPGQGGGILEEREAIKFEMFIFDALAEAANPLFFETTRAEEFAPLKNKTGTDSIETCKIGMMNLFARWLEASGVVVPMIDDKPAHLIEISPIFAWDAHSLREALKHQRTSSVNRIDEDSLFA